MIIVARNRVGEKTCAWNATAGEPYSCMDCGAKMHVTRKEGHDFFACFPGERHTTAHCIELSSQNRLHSTRRFDCESFFEYILEDTTQNNVHGYHPEMRQAAQDQQNGAQNAHDDLTFTSLKQMWDEGLIYRSAAMQLGNRRLISVLVSNRMTVDWEHDHINGPRIIQCRPEGFFQNERNNIMYCKWMRRVTEADKPFWEVKRIALNFASRAECENVVRQIFVKNNNGTGAWRSKVRWILLAANWIDYYKCDYSNWDCRKKCRGDAKSCLNCRGKLQGNFVNPRQIYVPMDPSNLTDPGSCVNTAER